MANAPDQTTAVLAMLCVFAIALPAALAISAVLVRAGCAVYNAMSAPEQQVPAPAFGTALLVAIPMVAVKLGVRTVLAVAFVAAFGADPRLERTIKLASTVISLPLAILATGALAAWLLPTSFGRGLLVTLAAYAVGFVCALVLLVIAVIIVTAVRAIG